MVLNHPPPRPPGGGGRARRAPQVEQSHLWTRRKKRHRREDRNALVGKAVLSRVGLCLSEHFLVLLTWFIFFTKCSLLRVLLVLVDGPVKVDRVLCCALLYLVVPLCISAASPLLGAGDPFCPRVGRGGSAVDQCVVALAAIVGGGTGRRSVGRGLETKINTQQYNFDPGKTMHYEVAIPSPKLGLFSLHGYWMSHQYSVLYRCRSVLSSPAERLDLDHLPSRPLPQQLGHVVANFRQRGPQRLGLAVSEARLCMDLPFLKPFSNRCNKKSCLVVDVYPELDRLVRHVLEVDVHIFPKAVMHGIDQELPGP